MPSPSPNSFAGAGPPPLRTSGTALHRQLFLVLRDQITRGVYAAGSLLPTEEALCQSFHVSRITVRRALTDLTQGGFVRRKHGYGTFVRPEFTPVRLSADLGLIESLRLIAEKTKVDLLELAVAKPPLDIAAILTLEPDQVATHVVRLRSAAGTPLMVTDSWVPQETIGPVTAAALRRSALYKILLERGIRFGRVIQEITAVLADPHLAGLLRTEVSGPLLRMTRLLHDDAGRPVQQLTVHAAPERSRILMELPSESMDALSGGRFVHDSSPAAPAESSKRRSRMRA